MLFLIIAGVISFIFGVLFLFAPRSLQTLSKKVDTSLNKLIAAFDTKIFSLRFGIGMTLLLASALAFFTVYFLLRKYG